MSKGRFRWHRPGKHAKQESAPDALESPKARPRWRRRLLIGFGSLVGVVVLLVGALFLYERWRFDQIRKVAIGDLAGRVGNKPFDILFVGSDSRSFVDSTAQANQYGSTAQAGGQRADVIIVARIVPALREVKMLSIPRDTYVDIPGKNNLFSGPNRINAAYNDGPQLLVKTITNSFHLPISNYVEINFPGLVNMVNAVGGVYLRFRFPVRDTNSHLGITKTGCHLVFGSQALALVRSRDLSYEKAGVWYYDGLGDLSRIQRQDAFFRALLPRLSAATGSPTGINDLLGAAVKNLTFDKTLSNGEVIGLGRLFHGMTASALSTETLPTIPWVTPGGADVQIPAAQQDDQLIEKFLAFGGPKPKTHLSSANVSTTVTQSGDFVSGMLTAAITSSPSQAVTVTTVPSTASPTSVETNTQRERWNPVPCEPK